MLAASRALALVTIALLASSERTPAHAGRGSDAVLLWKKQELSLDALPEELDPAAQRALTTWGPWAAEQGYALRLSDDGRVLLGAGSKARLAKDARRLSETIAAFDAHLPVHAPRASVSAGAGGTPDEGATVASPAVDAPAQWDWGEGPSQLEHETAVLLSLENADDLASAVDHLAARHAFLAPWAPSARTQPGFLLEQPLCAGYLLQGDGLEEYSPDHELVHRAVQLLCLRRAGRQPAWLQIGLAWAIEDEIAKGIWCFPGRTTFVARGEHGGWESALRNLHKKTERLEARQVLALERESYDELAARHAFGLAAHLARSRPEQLSALAHDFHQARLARAFVTQPDGRWEWKPEVELTLDEQVAILEKRLGRDWLDELLDAWKKGRL